MIKAFRYKMKPTKSQEAFLAKCFGCARFVYNHSLRERIEAYAADKKTLSFFDQCASLRELKKREEYLWLNEVPALMLTYSLLNLNNAYGHFFKTKSGFPKYKSKKNRKDSVKFEPNSTKYDFINNKVRLPKLGWVRICKDRMFDTESVKVNSTTISRDACGTFWCTVSVDDGVPARPRTKVERNKAIGIDVGIKDFAVLSSGEKISNPRFSESEEKRIAKMQRCLSRKRKWTKEHPASRRYERYRVKLARIHRRIENRRNDFLHKTSTEIVRRYQTICVEDLNVKGMMRNHNLAGSIASVSWSSFMRMLEYKSEWYGVNLLRAGRFDATSQTCSSCGYHDTSLKDLSIRDWVCPQCGARHDRDVNAATNILRAATEKYFNEQSPAVTGITDVNGADSENNAGTDSRVCDYASDETSMHEVVN